MDDLYSRENASYFQQRSLTSTVATAIIRRGRSKEEY
jgi:hypothetical protein